MKLHSLKIEARRPGGWESAELHFGKHITELFGPNGCGKTPIIQSVAYALGYPVKYRDDILAHCDAVRLTLEDSSGTFVSVRRRIDTQFDVEVRLANDEIRAFYNERDYSQFFFEMLGLPFPALTSMANEPTAPYLATLLPIFYLDQDIGYTNAYRAPASFIRDQYAEMTRLVFGLPPKNGFDQKKFVLEKKKRLEQLDRLIVRKTEQIEGLTAELGKLRRPLETVVQELASARSYLDSLKAGRGAKSDARLALEGLLYEKKSLRRRLSSEITELQTRVKSFDRIRNEIEIEVNTLSLNEEARRLFASFKDICANQSCGLFLANSDSYGKNLLYLRDQIKDLERNNSHQSERIQVLEKQWKDLNEEALSMEKRQSELVEADDTASFVEAISELTRAIIALQTERATLEAIANSELEYVRLLTDRKTVQDEIASLDGASGASDLRALQIRSALRERTRHWLDILKTHNVSREIVVNSDFGFEFGTEKLNQFHGSTLLRVVLAMRTAAFEIYAADVDKRLRFLILDTPRQQDIEKEALARYIAEIKNLSINKNAQIVFSTTDYHYDCDDGDAQWSPEFEGAEQKMFLRPVT